MKPVMKSLIRSLIGLAAVGLAYAIVATWNPPPRSPDVGPVSCDYRGTAFALGDQRAAEDGCNVCTCSQTGWSCTTGRCAAAGSGAGTISGSVVRPDGTSQAIRICALNLKEDKESCTHATEHGTTFSLTVPAGSYWVYAARLDDPAAFRAYDTEAVHCGLGPECVDRSPVTVTVAKGGTAEASPSDWGVRSSMEVFNVTPSKWEYSTHNYFPGSVFHARARNVARVEILFTPYPPVDAAPPTVIAEAAMESEDRGVQVWKAPVPPGFQAMTVVARGTTPEGHVIRSRELRVVRPIESASTTIE